MNPGREQTIHDTAQHPLLDSLVAACPEQADRVQLATALETNLARCDDLDFAASFADQINPSLLTTLPPEVYLQRVIGIGCARALVGIRFLGMDPTKPFVDLIAWSAGASSVDTDLEPIVRAALDTFSVFNPKRVRVLCRGIRPPMRSDDWHVTPDQHLLCGRLTTIAHTDEPVGVILAPANTEHATAFVEAAYVAFHERSPQLAERVQPAAREELESCAQTGTLSWWMLDNTRAGLIAAQRDTGFGLDGFIIIEEVCAPEFIGKGTAAHAQRALAAGLLARYDDLPQNGSLFGTIDARNIASLRTAENAGRERASTFWFIEPAPSG